MGPSSVLGAGRQTHSLLRPCGLRRRCSFPFCQIRPPQMHVAAPLAWPRASGRTPASLSRAGLSILGPRACPWRSQPALSATLQGNFFSRRRMSSNRGSRRVIPHILGGQKTHRGSRVFSEAEAWMKGSEGRPGLPGPAAPKVSQCLQRPRRLFPLCPVANAVADVLGGVARASPDSSPPGR